MYEKDQDYYLKMNYPLLYYILNIIYSNYCLTLYSGEGLDRHLPYPFELSIKYV